MVLATVLVLFASCGKDEEYDEDLLIGSWSATNKCSYVFFEDYTGLYTNKDGRQRDFTWRLDGDELELELQGYKDGSSTIITFTVYIVEDLTETRMEAYDKQDASKTVIVFTKK
jgi:hypothetical protein